MTIKIEKYKPTIAITMGDPVGCGPELIAKMTTMNDITKSSRIFCIGDTSIMDRAYSIVGKTHRVVPIKSLKDIGDEAGILHVLNVNTSDLMRLPLGQTCAEAGAAAYQYITTAIKLAMDGAIDGVVTNPINKKSLHLAGHKFDGHTEIFASWTQSNKVTMMLASEGFYVTHVSTHCSLKEATKRCKKDRIFDVIQLTNQGLMLIGIRKPRIAVAGLNPHSGEGGIFGTEEIDEIQPAINKARDAGFEVWPYPIPADTIFMRMKETDQFDVVVAQYHDQGHIAAKTVDFWGSVNITLGLPIIRTSVDHGTAFDIAGTGRANPLSLNNAIRFASNPSVSRAISSSSPISRKRMESFNVIPSNTPKNAIWKEAECDAI